VTCSVKNIILLLLCSFAAITVRGQKYPFTHYDIENGLPQSQVTSITQDNHNQIWISTLGGISCFDSKHFSQYTVQDGLTDNDGMAITADRQGTIWCGGSKGITSIGPRGLNEIVFKKNGVGSGSRKVIVDGANRKWVLAGNSLYLIDRERLVKKLVVYTAEIITAIQTDNDGQLYVAIYNRGIYCFDGNNWHFYCPFNPGASSDLNSRANVILDLSFDSANPSTCYFITSNDLYRAVDGVVTKVSTPLGHSPFTRLFCDKTGTLWLGSHHGLYKADQGRYTLFDDRNGFTNLMVFCIYSDKDNHLWFGTDGGGLYSYPNDGLRILDVSQGINSNVITSLETLGRQTLIATHGGGIFSWNGNHIVPFKLRNAQLNNVKMNFIFKDSQQNLWLGTDNAGLWKVEKNSLALVRYASGLSPFVSFLASAEGTDSTMWFAANDGCYYLSGNRLIKVQGINEYCSSLVIIGKDSVVVGTSTGVKLITTKTYSREILPAAAGKMILSLTYSQPFLFAGTSEDGIYCSKVSSAKQQHINLQQGLASALVYAIYTDSKDLWVGTSRGVSKYSLGTSGDTLHFTEKPLNSLPSESNQNTIKRVGDNIWIGTTQGVYIYQASNEMNLSKPRILIEDIQTNLSPDTHTRTFFNAGYKLPRSLMLPFGKSYLSIRYQAIQYDGRKQFYQYKLEGLDHDYGKLTENNSVDYPNLPPGDYVFRVRAVSHFGGLSDVATFPFIIHPAFYQTILFKLLAGLVLALVMVAVYTYRAQLYRRKQTLIARIKQVEQESIRMQTAADFHDDLGNKITRINMLTQLLNTSMPAELTNQRQLIGKIQASASEMYDGAKNILWALNPKNDFLTALLHEIVEFAENLFEDSPVLFENQIGSLDLGDVKLPLGYSHQILLIFKELFTNALKHSGSTVVTLTIKHFSDTEIFMVLHDNGKGFNTSDQSTGNGLRNIRKRIHKLQGHIEFDSGPGQYTAITLSIPLSKQEKDES
jgi:signal transduction histidine kinase/ligand-binding sensor domain-containing protein